MSDKNQKFINESKYAGLPPLPPDWLARLKETRGWTDEGIAACGLRMFIEPKGGHKKIAIPIRGKEGRLVNIRLYQPGAKQCKIISWYEGEGKDRVTYGDGQLWPSSAEWKDGEIWLCEGESDTICALSHGLNATTKTTGARAWKDEWTPEFKGRDVIICFDADKTGLAGAEIAANKLLGTAKSIRVIIWPDYLYKDSPHPKFEANKGLEDYSEFIREYGADYPANHGEDLTDFFVKHGKTAADLYDLLGSAASLEMPEEPLGGASAAPTDGRHDAKKDMERLAESEAVKKRYFLWSSGWKFKPHLLADDILSKMDVLADPLTGKVYAWAEKYWKEHSIDLLESRAAELLSIEAESARAANAARLVYLRSLIKDGRQLNDNPNMVCLRNTMLDIVTGDKYPHDKGYLVTQILDYDFDPDNADCPRWKKFLEEVVPDGNVRIQLQQFFGYCLTRDTKYAKCLLLKGPGSDGKSIILKVLQAMIGAENCSAVQMSRLEDPFERATLYGKLLNLSTEEDKGAFGSAYFKAIVTGDYINASFKHKDYFQFRPYCKLAFASNFFPNVQDSSDGFYRRILPIKFTRQFLDEDADKDLEQKLLNELPGIFAWALMGLDLLREHDGFVKAEASLDVLDEYKEHNNPAIGFITDCCEIDLADEGRRTSKDSMYEAYKAYCGKNGNRAQSKQNFGETLKMVTKVKDGKGKAAKGEPRPNSWIGIRLLPEVAAALPSSPPEGRVPLWG